MTRKRSRIIADDRGGDFGTKTPTEQHTREEVTPVTQVKIPRAQAFWVALPWSMAFVVTALLPIVIGRYVFFAATACVSIAALIWSIKYEMQWEDRASLPFLGGLAGLCIWRFYLFVGWRAYIVVIVASGSVLFWWLFASASTLTFMQRLAMPMIPQQFHVWKAIGNALETFLGIVMKRPSTPPVQRPILNKSGRAAASELPEREPDAVEGLSEIELFLMLADEVGTIKRDGGLAGLQLANGQKVTKNLWARNMAILYEQGYVTNGGSGYAWSMGHSAQTARDALV